MKLQIQSKNKLFLVLAIHCSVILKIQLNNICSRSLMITFTVNSGQVGEGRRGAKDLSQGPKNSRVRSVGSLAV